ASAVPPQSSKVVIPSRPQPRSRGESLPCSSRSPERSRKEVEGTSEESAFGPPVHDELTFSRKRFVSGHGFSRATKVLQSCHSEPSATALARRELALSEAKGHARNLLLVRRSTYEPIFLHREIRIRARLQPCRHSPPKLLFRAVRNRARAARACPVLAEALSEVERKSTGRARNLHLLRRFTMN